MDATSEFTAVVQYRLGAHRVVMGCEIDCKEGEGAAGDPLSSYVELKTYK